MNNAACKFDLASLMRSHKVTIRELARITGITMKQIRVIRSMSRVSYPVYCDLTQAVTGQNVFNRARYDAMIKQAI